MAAKLPATATAGEINATINYYARKKFYRHIILVSQTALQKRTGDPVLQFFYGFGLLMEGNINEALREFERIRGNKEVQRRPFHIVPHCFVLE